MSNQINSIISNFYQNPLSITKNNINLLKSIILTLDNANTSWMNDYNNLSIKRINDFQYNNLLPKFVIDEIKLNKHNTYSISFNLLNHSFNINFILFQNQNFIKIKIFKMIKHIYKILYLLITLKKNNCSLKSNINIYLHDSKKIFPKNKKNELTSVNVNSAYTWSCNKNYKYNEINIYREEEWFKVLIHECFHMFGLDFSYIPNLNMYNNLLVKHFNINIDFKVYEAYCETWAIILNSLYISYDNSYKVKSINNWTINILKKFLGIIKQEQYFSLFQTCKILKYSDIVLTNTNNIINYKETTPIFSYFIIKSILLFNINSFLEWCSINNTNNIVFNNRNINSFYQLIPSLHNNNKLFHTAINRINHFLYKQNNYNDYNFNNLRLSLNEIRI